MIEALGLSENTLDKIYSALTVEEFEELNSALENILGQYTLSMGIDFSNIEPVQGWDKMQQKAWDGEV